MPRRYKSKHGPGIKKQVVLKKHPESESQEVVAHGKDNNNLSNEEGSTGGAAGSSKAVMVDPPGAKATADELSIETTVSNAHLSDLLTLLFMARQENDQMEKELEEKENFLRNLKAMNKGLLEKSSSKKSKAKGKEAERGEVPRSPPSENVTDTRGAVAGSSGVLVNPVSRSCRKACRKDQGLKMGEAKKGKEEADDVGGARTPGEVVDEVVQSVTQELAELAVEEDEQQPRESRQSNDLGITRRRSRSMTRRSPDSTLGHKF